MQQQASRISPLPRNQRFPFSLDCETIFYRGALALRIYYICNRLRKLRQSANISHDLHLHDSPFYARSFKPSGHVNHNRHLTPWIFAIRFLFRTVLHLFLLFSFFFFYIETQLLLVILYLPNSNSPYPRCFFSNKYLSK